MVSKGVRRKRVLQTSQFPMETVKQLIREGKCIITLGAQQRAREDFGWTLQDIKEFTLGLKPGDFHKRDQQDNYPYGALDFYKPKRKVKGERVYMHFCIDEEEGLIIDSCHKQEN